MSFYVFFLRGGEGGGKGKETSFLFPPPLRLYCYRPIFCTLDGSDVLLPTIVSLTFVSFSIAVSMMLL